MPIGDKELRLFRIDPTMFWGDASVARAFTPAIDPASTTAK